ncbi:MAG: hypothetical protein ACN4GT_05255 [Gammaproteobacteria bacterium]
MNNRKSSATDTSSVILAEARLGAFVGSAFLAVFLVQTTGFFA